MEQNFEHDEFEEYLQRQVKNHRMFPADGVWRGIHTKLHGSQKWPALTIAAFLIISTTILICAHFAPKPNIFAIKPGIESVASAAPLHAQKANGLNAMTAIPFYKEKINSGAESDVSKGSTNTTLPSEEFSAKSGITAIEESTSLLPMFIQPDLVNTNSLEAPEIIAAKDYRATTNAVNIQTELSSIAFVSPITMPVTFEQKKSSLTKQATTERSDKNMADEFLKEHSNDVASFTTPKPQTVRNTFGIQVYVAPSISYRKLSEHPVAPKENTEGPVDVNYVTDVNNIVRHKPGAGIEAGVSLLYNLTETFRLKSGLQFNLRQYSIEAYRSNTEVARIALEGNDTINTLASYRTNNGYYSTELKNRFYQISIPIGIEWQVVGNKRIALNVAGSIQPTYLLNRNTYLLSTNFKNYSEDPAGIVRPWNINSNVEAYISLVIGNFKWQFGPQIRYQPSSTFISTYPINENLLDYGFKLGISTSFHK